MKPPLNPIDVPRVTIKLPEVPLTKIPPVPEPVIVPVPTKSGVKSYKTKKPYGYVLPILPTGPASEYRD